jgi:hypothetical protein
VSAGIDDVRVAVDAAVDAYAGDPVEAPLPADVSLRALHDAVEEYRLMGWTVDTAPDPLRLVIS